MMSNPLVKMAEHQTEMNYEISFRKASGTTDDVPLPVPFRQMFFVKRDGMVKWLYTQRADGSFWTVRAEVGLIGAEFTEWERHKQRQGAKSRAAARCKVERERPR